MAFLRRGNIRVPHPPQACITLHRIDGFPIKCYLKDISCFEEHSINLLDHVVTVYFTNNSSVAVREEFVHIDLVVNREAVNHVQ